MNFLISELFKNMDDLEELVERGDGVNFIPCVKWVPRGAAKAVPEKVKLTQEELATVIEKTKKNIGQVSHYRLLYSK